MNRKDRRKLSKKKNQSGSRNSDIVSNQIDYENKYKQIIVTYANNSTKSFTPSEWALFEEGIRKMNVKIEFINKDWKSTLSYRTILKS